MKKQQDKISQVELKKRVKAVFGTEQACAKKLNLSKNNFSQRMAKRSDDFLKLLGFVGVDVDIDEGERLNGKEQSDISDTLTYLIQKVKNLESEIKEKDSTIDELREEVKAKDEALVKLGVEIPVMEKNAKLIKKGTS